MLLDLVFIGLVMLDGWLTQMLLGIGAVELNNNPIVLWSVDHLWFRALLATATILLLRYFGKWKLREPLCFVWCCICVHNAVTLLCGKFIIANIAIFGQ